MASSAPITNQTRHVGRPLLRTKSNYEEAVMALNSLQSNAETIRKSLRNRSETRKYNIPSMINYLKRVGLSLDDVDRLSVVHVTGTKGKGSTCAFAESILRQYGYKTGIFSSPHLIEARERIRICGRPIDRNLFSSAFWNVYEKLQATKDDHENGMPHYFSFLTVMALYVFVHEQVDVTLMEVGIGGQYDSTNMVRRPVVCGVSSLDLDHTNLLGPTLEDIAWHKAGIFKEGAPAITVPQPESGMAVLLNRAVETKSPLSIAAPLTAEDLCPSSSVQLGIAGHKQPYNAALAVQLCRVWLNKRQSRKEEGGEREAAVTDNPITGDVYPTSVDDIPVLSSHNLSTQMIQGLRECRWPGRTQTIHTPGVTYYLDGAHTVDSMQQCVQWFQEAADKERAELKGKVVRALVFNMTGERPVSCLLSKLQDCQFDMAAFCPNVVSTVASENIPDQLNLTVEQNTVFRKSHNNRRAWDNLVNKPASKRPTTTETTSSTDTVSDAHSSLEHNIAGGDGDVSRQQCVSSNFPCIASALHWVTGSQGQSGDVAAAAVACTPCAADTTDCHLQVLVTGSLHLVGGVLELVTPHMND